MQTDRIYCDDALTVLNTLPDNSVNCCVTSPPYYALRDYVRNGHSGAYTLITPMGKSLFRELLRCGEAASN